MRALLLTVVLLAPAAASAQLLVVSSHGEKIAYIGTVAVGQRDQVRKLTDLQAVEVGFVYQFDAVYTLDLWAWNGRYCLYSGTTYYPISAETAATLIGEEVDRPREYLVPTGLAVIALVMLVLVLSKLYGLRLVEYLEKKTGAAAPK
jgi:hypothetical protein